MDFSHYNHSSDALCLYPAIDMSTSFKFRLSISYEEAKSVIDTFFDGVQYIAVYQHDADEEVSRTHIHGFISGFRCKSPKTFRKDFSNAFMEFIKDIRHDYAVGEIGPKPVEYCSKGRYDPVFIKGYDRAWIDYYKKTGYDGKKDRMKVVEGKIVIERDIVKEVKPKNDCEMIKEVANRCQKNGIKEYGDIAREILKVWDKNNKRGHEKLLHEWLDAVSYHHEDLKQKWVDDAVIRYEMRKRLA